MSDLRTAAQQALEALEADNSKLWPSEKRTTAITAIRAALAEPEGGGNLPPPLQKPEEFDHSIGADRFKVMRGAFWWHVLIGDSPTEHGKFRSRAGAEKMAADLLREFRNGAFVQHEAALAEPQQRKPLTEEEIESIWRQKPRWHAPPIGTTDIEFARAVERAHGIGGEE